MEDVKNVNLWEFLGVLVGEEIKIKLIVPDFLLNFLINGDLKVILQWIKKHISIIYSNWNDLLIDLVSF